MVEAGECQRSGSKVADVQVLMGSRESEESDHGMMTGLLHFKV